MNQPAAVDPQSSDGHLIHLAGAIQPIGFLIALSSDWMICRASANITQFLDRPIDEIIGHHINSLLCPDAVHSMRNRLSLLRDEAATERLVRCSLLGDERLFDASLHMSDHCVIIEAERSSELSYGDVTGTVRGMIGRLDQAPDMQRFLDEAARQVRALTGFDRVLISRFHDGGSGEVIAQCARSGLKSLVGNQIAASESGYEAASLGPHSHLRIVADIEAPPVPIVPALDQDGKPLDLSLSVLRSVAPERADYLRNIGVRAAMSMPIIVNDQPWGLIACHHLSPRCPSVERRSLTELFALLFSMRLEVRQLQA